MNMRTDVGSEVHLGRVRRYPGKEDWTAACSGARGFPVEDEVTCMKRPCAEAALRHFKVRGMQ